MSKNILQLAARSILSAAIRPAATLTLGLGLVMPLAGCDQPAEPVASPSVTPRFTPSTGSTSTLVGRATFSNPVNVSRHTGAWKIGITAEPLDVAVQSIVFLPGSQSGWHRHPGPVFILVQQGTMTFYESDDPQCKPIVRTAGQGFLDMGNHAHIARNETHVQAVNIVTYFAPPAAALRIDAPAPGNCPF